MLPSILHSAHEAKVLENGSGEWLCCLKRLYFLHKAVAATVVLRGVLDAVDPGKLLVCLSIGTESLAAAPFGNWNSGHTCTLLRTSVYGLRDYIMDI